MPAVFVDPKNKHAEHSTVVCFGISVVFLWLLLVLSEKEA